MCMKIAARGITAMKSSKDRPSSAYKVRHKRPRLEQSWWRVHDVFSAQLTDGIQQQEDQEAGSRTSRFKYIPINRHEYAISENPEAPASVPHQLGNPPARSSLPRIKGYN